MTTKSYILKSNVIEKKTFKIDYKSELNESQFLATTSTEGYYLIIAGAGSGKTRTLVYRVAYLVENGIKPNEILLLTFTRKAAQELLYRASIILDDRCKEVQGGTFHSFASLLLRKYGATIGYGNNFSIIDRGDAEDIIDLVRTDLGLTSKDRRFPKKNTILNIISKSINTGKSIEEIIDNDYPQFSECSRDIESIRHNFQLFKKKQQIMDYDDLLINLLELLESNQEIKNKISSAFRYIMIDEYQDTNLIQASICKHLSSAHNNLAVVGDDSQSIYSFRGALFKNIINFPNEYQNAKIITLEQNYRSTQSILNFTNSIIESAREKYSKKLFSELEEGIKPALLRPSSIDEQSQFIVQRILELREENVPLDQIAILFRSGWHSNELEIDLTAKGIPFIKQGGLKFIEASHIKDMISFCRVIFNPADSLSWYRILMLLEGVGPKTARELSRRAAENFDELTAAIKVAKNKYAPAVSKQLQTISVLRELTHPTAVIDHLIKYYSPLLRDNYDDFKKREDDLSSLQRIAEKYSDMSKFLTDITLDPPETSQIGSNFESKDDEKLTLSTVHSAKGLEWHTVFLISLVDGYLPSTQSLGNNADVEEERRLFYVATSRAKKNLYLLCPEIGYSRGLSYFNDSFAFSKPSRFLEDIGSLENLVDAWELKEEIVYEEDNFGW